MYRRTLHLSVILIMALTGAAAQGQPDRQHRLLERILLENIVPFWLEGALDHERGGYRLNHARDGSWLGPAPKGIVTQARTVWFFSRLYRSPYGKPEHLVAARHGFHFLRDHLWDQEFGGFYWTITADGAEPINALKHLYGQSFGLYALAEYYRASRDPEARVLAARLFGLLERHAWDREHGGYIEYFARDWSDPGEQIGPMGVPQQIKLMNTHLHLMEAFATYQRAAPSPLVRERLLELIQILSNSVVRKTWGACTDRHNRDWTPVTTPETQVASYGHDLENVWLLMDAADAAGVSDGPLTDLYHTLFDYSLKYGWDAAHGGFYYLGPLGGSATQRGKSWWVQAEVLVSALRMFQRYGDPRYLKIFDETLRWVAEHQVDWQRGDWFETIDPEGRASGVKSGLWKSPYHNGRAMLECLALLERNDRGADASPGPMVKAGRHMPHADNPDRILLEHVAFNVPEPAAMAEWYCRHLGMRVVREGPPPANARFIIDSAGVRMLELYRNPPESVPDYRRTDPLNLHVAFAVEDVAATHRRLLEAGATAVGDPETTPAGDVVVFLRDPWGVPLQLVKRASAMLP